MFFFRSLLVLMAVYRVKYPGHSFCGPVHWGNKADWIIRSLLVLLSAVDYANSQSTWWVPIVYVGLPCYTWFLILSAVIHDKLNLLFMVISVYGLLQSPWKNLICYKLCLVATVGISAYISLFKINPVSVL